MIYADSFCFFVCFERKRWKIHLHVGNEIVKWKAHVHVHGPLLIDLRSEDFVIKLRLGHPKSCKNCRSRKHDLAGCQYNVT